jgi:hypothetical protein
VQSDLTGMVFVHVRYADAESGETQVLTVKLGDGA